MPLSIDDAFGTIGQLVRQHALDAPERTALHDVDAASEISYRELDRRMDRVAAALQAEGLAVGDRIAICAKACIAYAVVFLGALRAGVVVAPLAPSSSPETLTRMLADAGARLFFVDDSVKTLVDAVPVQGIARIALDDAAMGLPLSAWLGGRTDAVPAPAAIAPTSAFNIIYSSGTTGDPKGIVQSHGMRWAHIQRGRASRYDGRSVTVLATPLYSNTTLVLFFPTLAFGGTVALLHKFSVPAYLAVCERLRATHTMLVPVQYQRLMASEIFDRHDLSSFVNKFSTSAPFAAALKADVLKRWPGGLIEYYGMTEGGGTCILAAHDHPDKLHTVGQPASGSDIRLIDDAGSEVAPGEMGEVVGHSAGMMTGYFGQPEKTRDAEWFDRSGKRFIRTGDVGRFDADGFLVLMDRKKDMIISGGFNIYPSDLEEVLLRHPAVREAAVVALPSEAWGESPGAFVVLRESHRETSAESLREWVNERVGKTQRLVSLQLLDELPRSAIGKVLKRELRDLALRA